MLSRRAGQRGVTLVEIVLGLAIGSALLTMGVVSFGNWVQNSQVRAEAESIQSGLQLARIKAVQSNTPIRFQLTTNLADCAISAQGTYWVVSQGDPTGNCGAPASDVNPPGIVQVGGGAADGAANADVTASQGLIVFRGTGQTQSNATVTIDIDNPDAGVCVADGGDVRCLRIVTTIGGQIRMCDPALRNDIGAC